MYELLVKDGTVIDPVQGIHTQKDIGISQGRITALACGIAPSEARRIIDAKGKIVTPGLIDIHCHVSEVILFGAVAPDKAGVLSGVTTVCDGGSTGYANFLSFRRFVIPQARTDVFCFLNMSSTGLVVLPEIRSWQDIDPEAMLGTIEENRDVIKGIKLRWVGSVMQNLGVEGVRVAKNIATKAGLPLMVHIGKDHREEALPEDTVNAFTRDMLSLLDKGDIITHIFTWKPGAVIRSDGSMFPEFKKAMQRGVLLDMCQGGSHWSFDVARKALEQGILPTTMSTDLSIYSIDDTPNVLMTMSKFLAVGLSLEQLVEMTTINPARILGEEHNRGSLGIGMPADISILELTEGDFLFSDGIEGKTFKGTLLLLPKLTLKSGIEIATQPHVK
ncbi:amidohydrolase family protein [Chloroflexota bacterium]